MITTTKDLSLACREARIAGAVGIDTEFVWNRTYYPTLGVVQMGYPSKKPALIDALAIDDWSPFAKLMADAKTVKTCLRSTRIPGQQALAQRFSAA